MIINKNSQLGLRFENEETKVEYLVLVRDRIGRDLDQLRKDEEYLRSAESVNGKFSIPDDFLQRTGAEFDAETQTIKLTDDKERINALTNRIRTRVDGSGVAPDFIHTLIDERPDVKNFLICDSVYRAAELIKIGEKFTSRTFKDTNIGQYTYLMGKNRMVRFVVVIGAICGFYYDDEKNTAFEFGLDLDTGDYYAPPEYSTIFSGVMQILAFVELGDIEVIELKSGRNNGKSKKDGKITNTHNYTVYVVDSTWNQIIIRTEGFGVRGHFKLQPCGPAHCDRKLIWVNAFEKNGYTRRPKAEIAR